MQLSSILLVDDDETTNFLNQTLVQRLGVARQVLVAENGLEALQVLASTCTPASPDCPVLILLDLNMPVMNGFQFLEAYQALAAAQPPGLIIVTLTTSLLDRDLARLQQLPVAGVLTKPLTRQKLHALLHAHFQHPLPE